MHKQFHDYLLMNFMNQVLGEMDLSEAARADLRALCEKDCKGQPDELANLLIACNHEEEHLAKYAMTSLWKWI